MSACQPDKAEAKSALTKAFRTIDVDHSDFIDEQELEKVLMHYYKATGKTCDQSNIKTEALAFLKEVDKNKDGKISLDEFVNYFMQFCK